MSSASLRSRRWRGSTRTGPSSNARPANEFVEALRDADLFRLLVPKEMGGAGLSPWELGPVIEALGACRRVGGLDDGARPGIARPTRQAGPVQGAVRQPASDDGRLAESDECPRHTRRRRVQIQRQRHLRQRLHARVLDGGGGSGRRKRHAAVRRRRAGGEGRCIADAGRAVSRRPGA